MKKIKISFALSLGTSLLPKAQGNTIVGITEIIVDFSLWIPIFVLVFLCYGSLKTGNSKCHHCKTQELQFYGPHIDIRI